MWLCYLVLTGSGCILVTDFCGPSNETSTVELVI
jgi:hypothetical protein